MKITITNASSSNKNAISVAQKNIYIQLPSYNQRTISRQSPSPYGIARANSISCQSQEAAAILRESLLLSHMPYIPSL